jgi:hypothetical protein
MSTVPIPHEGDDGASFASALYGGYGGNNSNEVCDEYQQQGRYYGDRRYDANEAYARGAPFALVDSRSAPSGDASGARGVRVIGTPLQFQWSGPKMTKDGTQLTAEKTPGFVLQHKPLENALIAQGLSPTENVNLAGVYLQKASNMSHQKIGFQFLNVNGESLKSHFPSDGEWATVVLHPGEKLNFMSHNEGKGLLLAANQLGPEDQINVNMSPGDMIKAARAHPDAPGKMVTELNLSGFMYKNSTEEEQLKPMSPLALVILANAKTSLQKNPIIDSQIRANLPQLEQGEKTDVLPDMQLAPTPFKPGSYDALIDAEQLDKLVQSYSTKNAAKAQPTSAKDHIIRVVPLGLGPNAHIGDLKKTIGVSQTDIDRSASMIHGAHLDVVYEIQHNGKKYDPSTSTKK